MISASSAFSVRLGCASSARRWVPQNSYFAYDDEYNGIVTDPLEGERIARALRGKSTMFMANHGVMVTGRSVSEAWHELYVWWVERDRDATERQTDRDDRDDRCD